MHLIYLICQGFTQKQMCQKLSIQQRTIGNYISDVLQDTDSRNRIELIAKVYNKGLMPVLEKRFKDTVHI